MLPKLKSANEIESLIYYKFSGMSNPQCNNLVII